MDPFPGAKTRSPRERRCQRVTSGGGACAIYGSGRPSPRPSPPPPPPPRSPTDCLTAPRAGPSPASPASPAAAERGRRPQPRTAAPRAHPQPRKLLLAQINLELKQTTGARQQLGPLSSSLQISHTLKTRRGEGAKCRGAPNCPNVCIRARGCGSPWGGPEGDVGRAGRPQGGSRRGKRRSGGGRGGRGAGLPRQGGALGSACFLGRPKAAGGPVCPRLGLAGRASFLPRRRPQSAGLGTHVGGGLCQLLSLPRWPRETPSPACPQARRVTKETPGSTGGQETRPASPATWSRVSGYAPCLVARPPRRQPL